MLNGMLARLALDMAGPDVTIFDLTGSLRGLEPRPALWDYHTNGINEAFSSAARSLPHGAPLAIFVPTGIARVPRGRWVVEHALPQWDLTHVIYLGGCYVPGHGMPTMLLILRAQPPEGETVLVTRCVRGEPATPAHPEDGLVWRSVLKHARQPGGDEWVRCESVPRASLAVHPWESWAEVE